MKDWLVEISKQADNCILINQKEKFANCNIKLHMSTENNFDVNKLKKDKSIDHRAFGRATIDLENIIIGIEIWKTFDFIVSIKLL